MAVLHPARSADRFDPADCRYMADFARAHLFVYARSLGTVLRVDGEVDASNARDLTATIRRFGRLKTPLVPGAAIRALLRLVHDNGLALADSVPEAFQNIEDIVRARREFLSDLARPRPARTHAGSSAAS